MNNMRKIIFILLIVMGLLFGSMQFVMANDLHNSNNIETFLLLGVDIPPNLIQGFGDASEVVAILSVNWSAGKIRTAFFSPQVFDDLLANNGISFDETFASEGNDFFKDLINEQYALDLDHVISLDFDGVVAIIDALGGLTINILEEDLDATIQATGVTSTGMQVLSGEQVVAYVSNTSLGLYNSQETRFENVASALREKRDVLNLKSILDLTSAVSGNLKMDLNLVEKTRLIQKGLNFNLTESRQIFIFSNTSASEIYNFLYFVE